MYIPYKENTMSKFTYPKIEIKPMNKSLNTSVTISINRPNAKVKKISNVKQLYSFGSYKHLTYEEALALKTKYDIASSQLYDNEILTHY